MFKKILVPIEPGNLESSVKSLQLARTLADLDGVVTILSVIEELPAYVASQIQGNFEHDLRISTQESLETLVKKSQMDAKIIIKSGHASGTIIQAQKSGEFDLLIIASHKPHNLDYLLGSTASRVVRKAECTVVVSR